MELNSFVFVGLILAVAFSAKAAARRLKIPEVTCYVLTGVLLGGSVLNVLPGERLELLQPLSTVALGIIAYMIGVELKLDVLRRLGRSIFFIVIFESVGAFLVVFLVLSSLFPGTLDQALLLAAVASATAPAATVAVIRQYKAKGTLTSTILAVVGIDDAVALIIYVFASSFVKASLSGIDVRFAGILLQAGLSVLASLAFGAAMAFLFLVLVRGQRENEGITLVLAAFILAIVGLSETFGISELLAVMVFSALIANFSPVIAKKTESILEYFTPIFLAAFFILGGAHLNVRLIGQVGLAGLAYFGARSAGKIGGAGLGALIGRAPQTVRKYVGFALLPQVGVALALALSIQKDFDIPRFGESGHRMAELIINILLFTTIITEVVGPLLTRAMLRRAGEVELKR